MLLVRFAVPGEAATRHVLILHSVDRGSLALDYFTGNFRVDVEQRAGDTVTFSHFVVTPSNFGGESEQPIIDFLRSSYANRSNPDLVMTVGGPAATFARKYRRMLFPDSPVMFAAVDERFLRASPLTEGETAVAVASDFAGIVEDILRLFPRTTTVFMVMGSGEIGRFWHRELERDFQRFRPRVTFIWSNDLTYSEILRRVSVLPQHSAVFHLTFGTDAQGGAYPEDRVLADLHAAANAPLFGGLSTLLGHGIVGGRLTPIEALPRAATEVALRILAGEPPGRITTPIQKPGRPIFDWRELRRWGVSESRLPPDSEIRFQPPGVWERFKWPILAGASAFVAETLLIAALLVSRVKRRRAEEALRESEGRFRALANSAPVMILVSDNHLRCTDVNLPWLAFTGRTLAAERGEGWFSGVHVDDRARYAQSAAHALESKEPFRIEYRLRRFDGEYRWILNSCVPRFTTDGAFVGYIASAIDISDLKAARAALSNLSGRLMEAQEQERARLARELHDDVNQRMSFLAMDLANLRGTLSHSADARGQLDALYDAVIALGRDIQAISHRLHSSKLGYVGLAAAAGSFCSEASNRHGMTIEYAHENVPADLSEGVAISLLRVLQESVSNAVRHSGARRCMVTLRGVGDQVRLDVVDDGRGFDVGAALTGHGLGLISMQERLRLVHGDVVIESSAGAGTAVRARIPVRADAIEDAGPGVSAAVSGDPGSAGVVVDGSSRSIDDSVNRR